jgi:1-acyl-sn-glycerol-3-phosphate acyltransferase
MKAAQDKVSRVTLPRGSASVIKLFAAYSRRYARRHFHSIRILKSGPPPRDLTRPLVIFLNHASWWDPLVCLLLSREFFPNRASFAPIDGPMLERYRFFKHLGFFGVEQHSAAGALKFLRTTRALLSSSNNAIWMTPQGRFMDVRERPLQLQSGLGALATHLNDAAFLPLAIEYAFWSEPRPEILVSFGEPIIRDRETPGSAEEWTKRFSDALEETQDELAARSCRRDSGEWLSLRRGASGVSKFYDAWRWLRAGVNRETFSREHHTETLR